MRRLLCLTATGLFLLGGTASAAVRSQPSDSDLSMAKPIPPQAQVDPPRDRVGPPIPPRPVPPWINSGPPVPPRPVPPRPVPPRPIPIPPWAYPRPPIPPGSGPVAWPIPPRPYPVYPVYPGYPSYPVVQDMAKDLLLTVEKLRDPSYTARSVQLGCAPVSGTHPDAGGACAVLTPAQGDPARITPSWTVCAQVQDPVRATATGIWNGRYIQFEYTYSNPCAMRRATGPVFSF